LELFKRRVQLTIKSKNLKQWIDLSRKKKIFKTPRKIMARTINHASIAKSSIRNAMETRPATAARKAGIHALI
jgi:hypothetical protein